MNRAAALQVLGLTPSATAEDIKRSHRQLAKQLHPDKPNGNALEFSRMQQAFERLTKPDGELHSRQDAWDSPASEHEWHPGPAHNDWTERDYALYENVWHCRVAAALELLRQGAKPDGYQNNVWGGTTLMLAAQHGNVELVKALLAHGASALCVDSGGVDSSKWAKRRKRWEAMDLIDAAKKAELMARWRRKSSLSRL